MPAIITIDSLWLIENEPRVLDTDLAAALGMARPTNIRGLIETNRQELENFGSLHTKRAVIQAGKGANREVAMFLLNEEQSLPICMLSRADRAKQVRADIITVFVAYRRQGWRTRRISGKTYRSEPARTFIIRRFSC
ncbi:hypothetical protein [Microvirga antarctica]|uniref:hypothetical protein n=1 Tax=Microvirga antarctica TaxID=2819233 RepID=UPI001B3102F3|nr:hypothetical protein [Microvirga antarctica]